MSNLLEITDDNFKSEVVEKDGVVVVDFYAEWCAPCKAIGAAMEELSDEYNGSVKICKGNIEANSSTLSDFGVTGIPAILLFKNGELKNQHIGLRSKKDLKKDIEDVRNG